MTEALKTDRLEQAKREIDEEWHAYTQKHNVRASGHYAREIKGEWAEEKLVAERARNLELRERLKDLQEELRDSARSAAEESNRERWRREETEI